MFNGIYTSNSIPSETANACYAFLELHARDLENDEQNVELPEQGTPIRIISTIPRPKSGSDVAEDAHQYYSLAYRVFMGRSYCGVKHCKFRRGK